MINLNKKQIVNALPKIKKGLEKYLWIQDEFKKKNVITDRDFQKKFNAFYRVRRNKDWQKIFYKLLEDNKNTSVNFQDILLEFYKKINRVEASFVSKLVATINPNMPIIDKIVFSNLKLKLPTTNNKNRNFVIYKQYQILIKEFSEFLKTTNGDYLVKQFTKEYPKAKITKVKMLDLILWQTRS